MSGNNFAILPRMAAACALCAIFSATSSAALLYGDFSDIPPGVVMYTDVTEAANSAGDEEPLFGEPTAVVNTLDFDPAGFGASATNGEIDITDGQLNFGFETLPGTGLTSLEFDEAGDYRFVGGSLGTQVSFSMAGVVTITELGGQALDPSDYIEVPFGNGAVFNALDNPTPTQNLAWELGTLVEFGAALVDAGFDSSTLVTAGEVYLNNTLIAVSEPGSLAFLAKKDFTVTPGGTLDPDDVIPEPATALLAALAVAAGAARRR